MQETHEGIKKTQGILKPRQRSIQKKREPRQGIRSKDPQEPSRGADPFRHKDKGRLGQLERKRQKKKTRNKSKRTQAPVEPSDLSWHRQKKPRGTRTGKHKKRMITSGFQVGRTGFRPNGKEKGKVEKTSETGMPRRAYLSTSQRRWPTRNFQKNQS